MSKGVNSYNPVQTRTVGYQAMPVVRFDIRRPSLLLRENQERKSLFKIYYF